MKNLIVVLSLLVFNIGCRISSESQVLSEKEFTSKMYEKMRNEFPTIGLETKKDLVIISKKGDYETIEDLKDAYNAYRKNPESLEGVFEKHIKMMNEGFMILQEKPKVTLDKIIPIIKHRNFLNDIANQFGGEEHFQIYEDYNRELIIVYAVDDVKSISFLNQNEFSKFNISLIELRKIAEENLFGIIGDEMGFNEKDGTFQLVAGGNFESSLILFPSLWAKENFDVKGDILISIPGNNKVLIFGSEDGKTREMMKMVTKTSYKLSGQAISNKFFKWNPESEIFEVEKY